MRFQRSGLTHQSDAVGQRRGERSKEKIHVYQQRLGRQWPMYRQNADMFSGGTHQADRELPLSSR
jgi:hypothetical protein